MFKNAKAILACPKVKMKTVGTAWTELQPIPNEPTSITKE